MSISVFIAWLNLFSAPVLFTLAISRSPTPMYFSHRLGLFVVATGLFFQSFVVFVGLDQMKAWGQLWAIKDIGCFILAFSAIYNYARLAQRKSKLYKDRQVN
jgi:hypothetical protein